MDFIIFRNINTIFRQEQFGGIVQCNSELLVLNNNQYQFLKDLVKYKYYSTLNDYERIIADIFLKKGIIVKMDIEKFKEIISE